MCIPDEVREILETLVDAGYPIMPLTDDDLQILTQWLDSQPPAPEPDWSKAPRPWLVMWWTVDGIFVEGYGYASRWHRCEPDRIDEAARWQSDDNVFGGYVDLPLGCDWRTTLTKRPEAA